MPISTSWRRTGLVAAAAFAVATAGVMAASPSVAATPATAALTGSLPTWATAKAAVGAVPSSTTVSVDVYLSSRDPQGLAAYATEVSDPASPEYHEYLTPAQQNARFGPTAAQQSAVRGWLASAGLKVTATTEQYVSATGSTAAIHAAFGTSLRNYSVAGHTYYAPQTTATVPAALASAVLGVNGLNDAPDLAKPTSQASQPAITRGAAKTDAEAGAKPGGGPYIGPTPCSTYYGQSGPNTDLPKAYGGYETDPVCGYLPNQLRDAYQVDKSGLTGKGVTVAVVDAYASPTIATDAATFDSDNGLAPFGTGKSGTLTQITDPSQWNSQDECGDWTPEESIDVEEVHTMAPGANVLYYGANSCFDQDFIAAEAAIVDSHLATIVSNSWDEDLFDTNGNESAANIDAFTQVFEQGATEGIGFYFSSGDCSTEDPAIVADGLNCDPTSSEPQVGFPSSDPWVTAVGGTAIAIGKHNNYEFETSMGDSEAVTTDGTTWSPALPGTFIFGSGGGTSNYFTQPSYQKGVVPNSLADTLLTGGHAAQPMREVPDVSMEGDLIASTMVGFTQELPDGSTGFAEAGYGGTSVAAPLFAGVQADAQQGQGGWSIGFANPEIYQRYSTLGTKAFHVVTDHPGGATEALSYDLGPSSTGEEGLLFTLGSDYTLHSNGGYSDATGVGSPSIGYLASFYK